jgi:hypothetical protein
MISDDYLRRVGFALRDLPWRMRRELLAELREHLAELPAEADVGARLGSPEKYAAELRSAAGLERRRGAIAFLQARRPRNLVLIAIALAIIGLAIGTVRWVDGYQPLVWSGGLILPAGATESPTGDGELADFHDGRPFEFGISIANNGRFAVRILGVPEAPILPFSAQLLMSKSSRSFRHPSQTPIPLVRFKPFDLQPDEQRVLVLRGVYRTNPTLCGSGLRWGGIKLVPFPIRYSFLWTTTTVQVHYPEKLWIRIRHKADRSAPLRGCR